MNPTTDQKKTLEYQVELDKRMKDFNEELKALQEKHQLAVVAEISATARGIFPVVRLADTKVVDNGEDLNRKGRRSKKD